MAYYADEGMRISAHSCTYTKRHVHISILSKNLILIWFLFLMDWSDLICIRFFYFWSCRSLCTYTFDITHLHLCVNLYIQMDIRRLHYVWFGRHICMYLSSCLVQCLVHFSLRFSCIRECASICIRVPRKTTLVHSGRGSLHQLWQRIVNSSLSGYRLQVGVRIPM